MEGEGFRNSLEGTSTSFQHTIMHGDASLSFRFVSSRRQVAILDGALIDLKDANVVLVDNVTDPKKVSVVSKVAIPSKLTASGGLVESFGKSKEIFSFLQCDDELPDYKGRKAVEHLCRDLRAASKIK